MGYRNPIDLRPYVGGHTHIMTMIGNGRCWHFDAWMYREGSRYLLRTQTRAGGRDVLQTAHYELYLGSASPLRYIVPAEGATWGEVTLQDRALAPDYDELNRIHWGWIRPMMGRRPIGYTSTSAAFHYVRAPSIDPVTDSVQNFFRYERNL